MTDRIKTHTGTLHIQRSSDPDKTFVMVTKTADASVAGITVPTAELLAAIDRADPHAMRSYLRERSDLIDAPDESCSTLEDMLPANLADEAARYRIDAVPEADSSEDVDERPACPACDPEHDDIDEPHDTPDGEHQHDEADPYADARAAGKNIGETMRAFRDAYVEAMKL